MSTRCNIAFMPQGYIPKGELVSRQVEETATAIIYRHSDGYPKGAGEELKRHYDAFKALRGYDDEYMAARVLQWMCEESEEAIKEYSKGKRDVLSFGICRQLHGDIEYLYVVTDKGIFTYKTRDGEKFEALV